MCLNPMVSFTLSLVTDSWDKVWVCHFARIETIHLLADGTVNYLLVLLLGICITKIHHYRNTHCSIFAAPKQTKVSYAIEFEPVNKLRQSNRLKI